MSDARRRAIASASARSGIRSYRLSNAKLADTQYDINRERRGGFRGKLKAAGQIALMPITVPLAAGAVAATYGPRVYRYYAKDPWNR